MRKAARIEALKGFYSARGLNLSLYSVETIQSCSRYLQKAALRQANGEIATESYLELTKKYESILKSILFGHPIKEIETCGDPRGNVLKIILQNGDEIAPERFN